jgi:antirestriction protein ArdC
MFNPAIQSLIDRHKVKVLTMDQWVEKNPGTDIFVKLATAFYDTGADVIVINTKPLEQTDVNIVMAHELIHWTSLRVNRPIVKAKKPITKEERANEEAVAYLGTLLLAANLGLSLEDATETILKKQPYFKTNVDTYKHIYEALSFLLGVEDVKG